MTPEMIHPVQLGATLGQPDQADAQLSGQVLRPVCSMAGILVQEQGDLPAPVMAVKDCQERSEVLTTLPPTCQEQPMPGVDVDRDRGKTRRECSWRLGEYIGEYTRSRYDMLLEGDCSLDDVPMPSALGRAADCQ